MKIDPYNHEQQFLRWREQVQEGIPGIPRADSDIILRYLSDMYNGLNIASGSAKGPRSFSRLNNLRIRMIFFSKRFNDLFGKTLLEVSERELFTFFNNIRNGRITRGNGKPYRSAVDFVKIFKAFWHWHMKVSRKQGIAVEDITEDLDTSRTKPKWVYLTEQEVQLLCEHAQYKYRPLIMFMYDTGLRSPGELINLKVSDFSSDYKEVNIRQEVVKRGSFGRRIKLMLSSTLVKRHIEDSGLDRNDEVFKVDPSSFNRYLKRLGRRVLGEGVSPGGERYSKLTMYDFRHCSCCYWLPRYKSESALMYRFGWKKSDKIHYYSELLGMRDTISEEDMFIDGTKTAVEKEVERITRENEMLRDQLEVQHADAARIKTLLQTYLGKFNRAENSNHLITFEKEEQ